MRLAHVLAAAAVALAASTHAQPSASDQASHRSADPASSSAAAVTTEGEVRKVDREGGKVTLKHGPIENLAMPGMTMVFKVSDPKLLDFVRPGDKVKFAADNINGSLTVTAIEASK